MTLLTVRNLSVQLEDRPVVESLSFDLAAGERLSILGPNGAGKTVLLKALLNLLPHQGEIAWAPDVRIGYVPQRIDADTHLPLTFTDLFRAKCTTLNISSNQLGEISNSVGLTAQILKQRRLASDTAGGSSSFGHGRTIPARPDRIFADWQSQCFVDGRADRQR